MTAAKVMDMISRLPGCSEQAADAVSAYAQVKMEDASTFFLKNFKVRMSRYWDTSTEAQNGPNHGLVQKTQSFLSKGISTVILWQDSYGKAM